MSFRIYRNHNCNYRWKKLDRIPGVQSYEIRDQRVGHSRVIYISLHQIFESKILRLEISRTAREFRRTAVDD